MLLQTTALCGFDPADSNAPPAVIAAKAGDQGTYTFTGVALCMSNTVNLGRFRVDDLRRSDDFRRGARDNAR